MHYNVNGKPVETSALSCTRDRESGIATLSLERDCFSSECAKLHTELSFIRGSLIENTRFRDEIRACAAQLEQAREEESAEAVRLQNQILSLISENRDAEFKLQTCDKAYEQLKRVQELCVEECDKLRAELRNVRSAASVNISLLMEEFKACTVQTERLTLPQQETRAEIIRLKQEISVLAVSAQERDFGLQKKLKQRRDQGLDDGRKLRAELATIDILSTTVALFFVCSG